MGQNIEVGVTCRSGFGDISYIQARMMAGFVTWKPILSKTVALSKAVNRLVKS